VLADGHSPRTSTAGVRDVGGSVGECYHPACYSVVALSAGWSVSRRQRARLDTDAARSFLAQYVSLP